MHGLITSSKDDTKVTKSFTRSHKKSASESVVDLRLFQTGAFTFLLLSPSLLFLIVNYTYTTLFLPTVIPRTYAPS